MGELAVAAAVYGRAKSGRRAGGGGQSVKRDSGRGRRGSRSRGRRNMLSEWQTGMRQRCYSDIGRWAW